MKLIRHALAFCCLSLLAANAALAGPVSVLGRLTRQATLQPGGKSEGTIVLRNNTDEPREVRVYQTDYLFYADGRNIYGEPGSVARSNSSWIAFAPRQVVVAAKATSSVHYTIQVPQEPGLAGTYWSMLMVEPLAEGSLDPPEPEKGKLKVGIRTVIRYGIQFVTHIADSGKSDIRFRDKRLLINDGKQILQLDIQNTGESWLRPLVWAQLYDEHGASMGRFDAGRLRLYPGCSARFRIDLSELSQLPAGNYTALIVADNGDEHVFGAQYKLHIE